MNEIYIFIAEGFEEVEAITPVDILRRAALNVHTVSATVNREVKGAHGISIKCDLIPQEVDTKNALMLILPGGMRGAANLKSSPKVTKIIRKFAVSNRWIAAICAAPMILGEMDLLRGKRATCYPGYEPYLKGAEVVPCAVITDGNIITGRSMGAAVDFSLEIVTQLLGEEKAKKIADAIMY